MKDKLHTSILLFAPWHLYEADGGARYIYVPDDETGSTYNVDDMLQLLREYQTALRSYLSDIHELEGWLARVPEWDHRHMCSICQGLNSDEHWDAEATNQILLEGRWGHADWCPKKKEAQDENE